MQKDPLANLLATIEKETATHNIIVHYGSIEENEFSPISNIDVDGEWPDYLKILKTLEARVVTIVTEKNDVYDIDLIAERIQALQDVAKEESYSDALSVLRKNEGELVAFNINFYCGLLNYRFDAQADWYFEYLRVKKLLDEPIESADLATERVGYSNEQINQIARLVVIKPEYIEAKSLFHRKEVCLAMAEVGKIESYFDRSRIAQTAETIFTKEIFPGRDKELGMKILEMKNQGFKKNQIKAQLNITDNTLDRHWYKQ